MRVLKCPSMLIGVYLLNKLLLIRLTIYFYVLCLTYVRCAMFLLCIFYFSNILLLLLSVFGGYLIFLRVQYLRKCVQYPYAVTASPVCSFFLKTSSIFSFSFSTLICLCFTKDSAVLLILFEKKDSLTLLLLINKFYLFLLPINRKNKQLT